MERPPLRVLVTGASSGFIGGHTCNVLSQAGSDGARAGSPHERHSSLKKSAIEICYGDLSDPWIAYVACKNIDIVVHRSGCRQFG